MLQVRGQFVWMLMQQTVQVRNTILRCSVPILENLDEKQEYRELPDTYVIFITENGYYKAGKPVYVIQNMNLTLGKPFDDGSHILYVNGEYRDDSDIGRLMHDFNCTCADDTPKRTVLFLANQIDVPDSP